LFKERNVDMNTILTVFADVMLWSSIPLLGVLGYEEHQLVLSNTGHNLVLLLLLVFVFKWSWFWFSWGENRRLERKYSMLDISQRKSIYLGNVDRVKEEIVPENTRENVNPNQGMNERIYASNH
jgi:hypothetical protein